MEHRRFPQAARADQGGTGSGSLNGLEFEGNGNLFADQYSTGFQRSVEVEAEFPAIDLRGSRDADARVAPGVFHRWGRTFDSELNIAGHAVDGERTGNEEVSIGAARDARRAEGEGGEFIHIEKVGTLEMRIALGVAGIDGGDIDGCFDAGFGDIGGIVGELAGDTCELPADVGDHQVPDA